MAKAKSLNTSVSQAIKGTFDLDKFKKTKHLDQSSKFKTQKWIPFSPALQEALSIPGIPMGHNSMVRGKSNTGKSTMTIEVAVNAQKMGILPVLIITEMKHDWNHWRTMGFEMEDIVDEETGEIDPEKQRIIQKRFFDKIGRYKTVRELTAGADSFLKAESNASTAKFYEAIDKCNKKYGNYGVKVMYDEGGLLIIEIKSFSACKDLFSNTSCIPFTNNFQLATLISFVIF